jgi:hypothetical protein
MRLADTASVTFTRHLIPRERYIVLPDDASLHCISDYQRCWFHLFLVEIYLARLDRLQHAWGLQRPADRAASLNELAQLREYSLHLLDDFSPHGGQLDSLMSTTTAMKLRTSMLAQSTMRALDTLDISTADDVQQLRADTRELSYISSQPTSDRQILCRLGVSREQGREALCPAKT